MLRLTFRNAETEPAPSRTEIIAATPENPRVRVEEDEKFLRYCTEGGQVELKKYPFAVRFLKNGKELCRLAKCGLQLRPTEITEPHWETVPGTETGMKLAKTDVMPRYRFWLSFDFGDDERILGLG